MRLIVDQVVFGKAANRNENEITISSPFLDDTISKIKVDKSFAYFPLINSHDHLIGNWYPPAINSSIYPNANIWVEDMKASKSVRERDNIFINSIPMNFLRDNGMLLAGLGGYKNLFSGVGIVQDHAPLQDDKYYDLFPIEVVKRYRQLHSVTLGNFWGGEEPIEEWKASHGTMPFIVHLGEGLDEATRNEFNKLKEMGVLQPNTLLIHGISLTEKELQECADTGTSICWCPYSNFSLIGQTLDVDTCLRKGVNVVIGTDSTLSGSINLLSEMSYAHQKSPHIPAKTLYQMVSQNAIKALFLGKEESSLQEKDNDSVLLMRAKTSDPYENLLESNSDDILLHLWRGKPVYGDSIFLEHFAVEQDDYFIYKKNGIERFVIGHPEKIIETIDNILGYPKTLPYLPFQNA